MTSTHLSFLFTMAILDQMLWILIGIGVLFLVGIIALVVN